MGMGKLILRADTAPIAAITILRQAWGWSAP
jgi:16S rRNA U1498 N3-methylase RsmE